MATHEDFTLDALPGDALVTLTLTRAGDEEFTRAAVWRWRFSTTYKAKDEGGGTPRWFQAFTLDGWRPAVDLVVTGDAVSETVVERGGRLYDVSGLELSLNELRAHLRSELFGDPDDDDGGEPAPVAPALRSTTAALDALAATMAVVCTAAVFAKVLA